MGGIVKNILKNANAANTGNLRPRLRLVSLQKLRDTLVFDLCEEYVYFGKAISYQRAQMRAASVYSRAVSLLLGPSSTLPWNWEEHALMAKLMIMDAGFSSDHLIIVEFVSENNPDARKTMTLYSSENREFFKDIPADFEDFCNKLVEICDKMALSQPRPGKPSPMLALFNYSPCNHKVFDLMEKGIDIKSALMSLLRELEVIKDKKCKVQVFDPYKIYPNYEFQLRHAKYRPSLNEYRNKVIVNKGWLVTPTEHKKLLDKINETLVFDHNFRKIVNEFATKHLPKHEIYDPIEKVV